MTKRMLVAGIVVAIGSALPVIGLIGQSRPVQLEKVKLPAGFHISTFAEGIRGPRSLTISPR